MLERADPLSHKNNSALSNFPFLNAIEFSDACIAFLPRLHSSNINSRLLYSDKLVSGINEAFIVPV